MFPAFLQVIPLPASQTEAMQAVFFWLLLLVGGPVGLVKLGKWCLGRIDWIKETRRLIDEVIAARTQEAKDAERDNGIRELAMAKIRTDMEGQGARLTRNIDGVGGKIAALDKAHGEHLRDHDHLAAGHNELRGKYEASEAALPDKLTKARHDVKDELNGHFLRIDGDLEELKRDQGVRIDRLEQWRNDQGSKGA
jgi:hypothetical protein